MPNKVTGYFYTSSNPQRKKKSIQTSVNKFLGDVLTECHIGWWRTLTGGGVVGAPGLLALATKSVYKRKIKSLDRIGCPYPEYVSLLLHRRG